MRILLDECVPRGLKRELPDYETSTVPEMGWAGKTNGELLALAEGEFDVLLTADQSVPLQQNLRLSRISVVTPRAKSSDIDELRPLIPRPQACSVESAGGNCNHSQPSLEGYAEAGIKSP